jgi:hypothetical protein
LLSAFDLSHFHRLLDQATAWLGEQTNIDQKLKDAIHCRLVFRHEFLSALDQDIEVLETRSTENFESCLAQLGPLRESVPLGKPVPESFSLKIQRKLASTVPPRPMVNLTPEDALSHLQRLCQDAIDMQQMLDYRGPSNFKVCIHASGFMLILIDMADCCVDSAFSKTATINLYPLSPPGYDCQQFQHSWNGSCQGFPV